MPGLRRAGGVEPGEAEAGLPVLRHRVAVQRRRATGADRGARSRQGAARAAGRAARLADREAHACSARAARRSRSSIPTRVGQNCEFCGSPALVDYKEIKAPIRPQSLLPFKVAETAVREQIRRWYASKWLAPGALKARALVDTVHGVYIPYWTFDAQVVCPWDAEAGHYYYTTETLPRQPGRHADAAGAARALGAGVGRRRSFLRRRAGAGHAGRVARRCCEQVEPFPTNELVPYDTAFLSGFVVEHYQVVLLDAAKASRGADAPEAGAALRRSRCRATRTATCEIHPTFSGADVQAHARAGLAADVHLRREAFPGVVNGYTGRMAGQYPKSLWKISSVVGIIILVILLLVLHGTR